MFRVDTDCARSFSARILDVRPNTTSEDVYIYPQGATTSHALIIEVQPVMGAPWVGVFSGDYSSTVAMTGLVALPDGKRLCAVARGRGYVVNATVPRDYRILDCYPIVDWRRDPACTVVALADFVRVAVCDRVTQWTSPRLSWDGIELLEVTSELIKGKAWSAPDGKQIPFTVVLRDRRVEGGASP